MPELSLSIVVCLMAVLHCALGWLAAIAAKAKGYNFKQWIVWGTIGGTAALVVALTMQQKSTKILD